MVACLRGLCQHDVSSLGVLDHDVHDVEWYRDSIIYRNGSNSFIRSIWSQIIGHNECTKPPGTSLCQAQLRRHLSVEVQDCVLYP